MADLRLYRKKLPFSQLFVQTPSLRYNFIQTPVVIASPFIFIWYCTGLPHFIKLTRFRGITEGFEAVFLTDSPIIFNDYSRHCSLNTLEAFPFVACRAEHSSAPLGICFHIWQLHDIWRKSDCNLVSRTINHFQISGTVKICIFRKRIHLCPRGPFYKIPDTKFIFHLLFF